MTLVTANGLHPEMSPASLLDLFGPEALERWPLVQHDPDSPEGLSEIGLSPYGHTVQINSFVAGAEAVIALSAVSIHYFAGFGGARKMLLPGTASRESISNNHRMVVSRGVPGPAILRGNPLHREMRWVEETFKGRLFHILVGLDRSNAPAALWGGEGGEPLQRATRWVRGHYEVPIRSRRPFAIASCGGMPKDINLIQTHKSLEFAHRAVEPGGVLLLASECPQGVGSKQFLPWFRFADPGGGEAPWREALLRDYQVNGQTALAWYRKCRSREVWMVTDLPASITDPVGVRRLESLDEGLEDLERRFGRRHGWLIPHAAQVLPRVAGVF